MANLNFVGSVADRDMNFSSATDVKETVVNELFHAISVYIPKRFAKDNIKDWEDRFLTSEVPALFTAVASNYNTIMAGELLRQWSPVFNEGANLSVIVYLIVFDDTNPCEVQATSITHTALEDAFTMLFFLSFFKLLFDPTFDGSMVTIPPHVGTPTNATALLMNQTYAGMRATQTVKFINTTAAPITFGDGERYMYNSSTKISWDFMINSTVTLSEAGSTTLTCTPANDANFDPDPVVTVGTYVTDSFVPALPNGVSAQITSVVQGNGTDTQTTVEVLFVANSGSDVTIPAESYQWQVSPSGGADASLVYNATFSAETPLSEGGEYTQNISAVQIGFDANLVEGGDITAQFLPTGTIPPTGIVVKSTNVFVGQDAGAGNDITILAGQYRYNSGGKVYTIDLVTDTVVPARGATQPFTILADQEGPDSSIQVGAVSSSAITPMFPIGLVMEITGFIQGTDTTTDITTVPSMYFDLSLVLATLCKSNPALSLFITLVKVSFVNRNPNVQDACWAVYQSRQAQLDAMKSLLTADRARYYWAALMLLECENTWMLIHSEPDNIVVPVFSEWFRKRNASKTFIGNKLANIRLSGLRIKPFGYPSLVDSSVQENAAYLFDQLLDMNVGHLQTISDSSVQDCRVSIARCIGPAQLGKPVSMLAIAKFVDYTCSMKAADWITDKGTLTSPIMTDEEAYGHIQALVFNTLSRFSTKDNTKARISNIRLEFPSFQDAKKSRTMLSAASSWLATYTEDLMQIEVSGGIVSE